MDDTQHNEQGRQAKKKNSGCLKVAAIILAAAMIASVCAVLVVKYVFFPSAFKPVTLSPKEEKVLTEKIDRLNAVHSPQSIDMIHDSKGRPDLKPERYSEDEDRRTIAFSEKEFNALIAKNTNLADKLAIDFSGDLASMKLLVPLDPDVPILGGKILKVTAGVELGYLAEKPVVKLRGVSLWGVPIPNAWLGNLKNVDLVNEFGDKGGFWKTFAAGVEEIKVKEDHLSIRLKP